MPKALQCQSGVSYARRMKILVLVSMLLVSACTTIHKGPFGPDYKSLAVSYVDTTGLYWLERLENAMKNGCVNDKDEFATKYCSKTIVKSDDSPAENECETYGARLPTLEEYNRLLKDFQADSLDKGVNASTFHALSMAFKDDVPFAAWTSTVRSDNTEQAYYFSFKQGAAANRLEYRSVELPVRCVRKP